MNRFNSFPTTINTQKMIKKSLVLVNRFNSFPTTEKHVIEVDGVISFSEQIQFFSNNNLVRNFGIRVESFSEQIQFFSNNKTNGNTTYIFFVLVNRFNSFPTTSDGWGFDELGSFSEQIQFFSNNWRNSSRTGNSGVLVNRFNSFPTTVLLV